MKKIFSLLLLVFTFILASCNFNLSNDSNSIIIEDGKAINTINNVSVLESEYYTSYEEVSLYIIAFEKLPDNYFVKDDFFGGKRDEYSKDFPVSVGGDRFYNREGLLPKEDKYYECDIDYDGFSRNAKRLVFSLETFDVYYTSDHYKSFTMLYDNKEYVYDNH